MKKQTAQARTGPAPVKNRQASFEYEFLETFTAGIMLSGPEVKSLREGKVQLQDAYATFQGDELFLLNLQINPYNQGSYNNPDPRRPRKLLLQRRELNRLKASLKQQGLTVVPIRLFFNARRLAKLELALAKGKKLHDKRESIKTREQERELRRTE